MNRMTLLEKGCDPPSPSNTDSSQPRNSYSNSSASGSNAFQAVDRRRFASTSTQRRPSVLESFRGLLHPRTGSLGERMFRRAETFRRVQVRECEVDHVYDLRDDKHDFYDDDAAFRRPRSNSSDFLILRKTSRPLSVNVVGLIDQQTDPYRQYMKVVDTYELCPQNSRVHIVDDKISARKAFSILRSNKISSLLVLEGGKGDVYSILTLTDFLICLRTSSRKTGRYEILVKDILSGNRLVTVTTSTKILEACEELQANNLHRLAVVQEYGDVVFLITIRRVLTAIHKQNRSLHFAQWLSHPIKISTIGTWGNVKCISKFATISLAMEEMIGFRYSTMPVVDENKHVIGVVTKKDICYALPLDHPNPKNWLLNTKIQEIMPLCKRQIFIKENDTVGSVMDALLNGKSNTAFVIQDDKAAAAISLSDFLDYLLNTQSSTNGMPTPSSSGSSSENIRTFSHR